MNFNQGVGGWQTRVNACVCRCACAEGCIADKSREHNQFALSMSLIKL